MIVTNSLELKKHIQNKKAAVALGSFDALHKGHMKVISKMVGFARKNGILSIVQLFEKPLRDERVNLLDKRISLLENIGVDIVVVERFDDEFCSIKYKEFVSDILKNRYNAAKVFSGENYRFGHNAEGDALKLKEECKKYGIETEILPCLKIDDNVISSTAVRTLLKSGDVASASELLERPYEVEGEIIHGRGFGHTIGFPTANISIPENLIIPKDGVYLTKVSLEGKSYAGITNVGAKPTVDDLEKSIETYISGIDGDLYGKTLKIEFIKRIRNVKKFDDVNALKAQLEEDKKHIKGL